jgi:SAM-dependent methyltransferase/uncharacterized protein YbaR (Trm112 family)
MDPARPGWLEEHLALLQCPACQADLALGDGALLCFGCGRAFGFEGEIPLLFWPHEVDQGSGDVTERVRAFYEQTPFPDYDDFDDVGSLIQKARRGLFAKLLDDQVPPGSRVLECGCGTGQLSNFLSVANRTVFGTDLCLNSLKLGQAFKERNGLSRVRFLQMNLFRPAFKPAGFDLVISNGVLHHTSRPFEAFRSVSNLVRPGGFVLVGLYHRYGRLVTDARRLIFRTTRDRFTSLDPNLRAGGMEGAKRRAWFLDQYKNPHESKHTIGEVLGWFQRTGFDFVTSIPRSKPLQGVGEDHPLFEREAPGSFLERAIVELGMILHGSREGGFFIAIGQKRV